METNSGLTDIEKQDVVKFVNAVEEIVLNEDEKSGMIRCACCYLPLMRDVALGLIIHLTKRARRGIVNFRIVISPPMRPITVLAIPTALSLPIIV